MLSRSQQKMLRKLRTRKHRWEQRLFVAEGRKVVEELLNEGLKPEFLLAEKDRGWGDKAAVELEEKEFRELSSLEQADEVIGVFSFPKFQQRESKLKLIIDQVRDPGNLGTLIRTADWFGCNKVFCTTGTVDAYNAKTVQSSMGSIARVEVVYADSEEILEKVAADHLLCADMEGEDLNQLKLEGSIALVLGSESHGPSDFWKQHAREVTIPRQGNSRTESLNVAVAGAIFMAKLAG